VKSKGREDPLFPKLAEDERIQFPDPGDADEQGILCSGGNLSPGVILSAYSQGIFPWFSEDDPLLWWSPDPRFVLFPAEIQVSESMRKVLKKGSYTLTLDTDFRAVIEACAAAPRRGQNGTWITDDMVEAYVVLHELGYAHSVEARKDGELAGGLYGISLGRLFCGESMFSRLPNASKAALIALAWRLADEDFLVIDSQVHTAHVASMGGREIPRSEYLTLVRKASILSSSRGDWGRLFPDFPLSEGWKSLRKSTL
jgi:leucyl/phenylalanyl-tRNA---protein transferase